MTDSHSDPRLILALMALPGVGRKTAARLLDNFGPQATNPDELAAALSNAHAEVPGLAPITDSDATDAFAKADESLDRASELCLTVLTQGSPQFPTRLARIPDPPLLLYVRGNVEAIAVEESIAIIGTRKPTEYGIRSAHRLALRCAEARVVVVSGLAKGCDGAAHEGCLDADGKTVAVLAHGLDTVYPAAHRDLAARIVDGGGALMSEYSPAVRARSSFFVERDRLQSGLARAVLVIETDVKGGTMHTVGFAHEQGRLVACLNHPEHLWGVASTKGTQRLIKEGNAVSIDNGSDLARLIQQVKSGDVTVGRPMGDKTLFPVDGSN